MRIQTILAAGVAKRCLHRAVICIEGCHVLLLVLAERRVDKILNSLLLAFAPIAGRH
jgi:hypothetical protein